MVISKYITMRDYSRTLWFLLIAIMFLSVVGDYPCQALGIWAMLFAGYGIGIPSIDKRYVIMSTVCYVVATILFMAGDGRFILVLQHSYRACLYLVSMICPYCGEIIVEPNKEHFFPQMIYPNEWDFYACRECNRLKGQHICGRYQGI